MKYPRMTRQQRVLRGSGKLTETQIEKIKILRLLGLTYVQIAYVMKINKTMVMYWCLPEFREKVIRKNSVATSRRWQNWPQEKRSLQSKRALERIRDRCKTDKLFEVWYKTYHREHGRKSYIDLQRQINGG